MFRFKRYDEALLAESLARFGWEKLVALPIGESDRAPVAMLLVEPIVVSGGLRGSFDPKAPVLDALEFSGPLGTTVRLLVPSPPPQERPGSAGTFLVVKKKDGVADEKVLPDPERFWWDGWAKILTASALLPPRTDSVRLADVLRDQRVLRLFCDTNALASGVAEWFLHVLPSGTQLISSAIADKEIMSWADRHKKLYEGSTAETWEARLRYLLARRLTEYPPQHTVIDRLSPDQNALMLAQGTGEGGSKSSQGDLLFVELARPLVREQPRQARVIFLTGMPMSLALPPALSALSMCFMQTRILIR
jgi:hypothetical protein